VEELLPPPQQHQAIASTTAVLLLLLISNQQSYPVSKTRSNKSVIAKTLKKIPKFYSLIWK
jgi:hypothetical protein